MRKHILPTALLAPDSGWLHAPPTRLLLRLQEGAERPALAPVDRAARTLKLPTTTGDDWTILWAYKPPWQLDPLKKRRIKAHNDSILLNHLPGTVHLASKAHLIKFAANLAAKMPRTFSALTPETYALPEQAAQLKAAIARRGLRDAYGWPNWFVKSKNHRGISVLNNFANKTQQMLGQALVQERVRPLLLPGLRRAFDIGLYVLISSVKPLHVWAFDRALVRFCEADYPQEGARSASAATNWARAAFADKKKYVIKEYTPLWRLPYFEPFARNCSANDAACALRGALDAAGYDSAALWRKMKRVAASLLMGLRHYVEAGLARQRLRSAHVFEVFRFDFLVDEDGLPVLTEVNLSPNLAAAPGALKEDGATKQALIRAALGVAQQRFAPPPPPPPLLATPSWFGAAAGGAAGAAAGAAAAEARRAAPADVPVSLLRGISCDLADGAMCCALRRACASSWARLDGPRCLSVRDVRTLARADAEARAAHPSGMERIWPARMGTGAVRTLWPSPPREDRLLACCLGVAL